MTRSGKYATLTTAEWDAQRAEVKAEAAKVVKANAEEAKAALKAFRAGQAAPASEAEAEGTEGGYADWTNAELKAELESRELPVSGNKDELIARLTEDDESE